MQTRALSLLVALALAGCVVDEIPPLTLVGFHGLSAEDGGCTYTEAQMSSSTFDTGLAKLYRLPFNFYAHLRNDLAPHANPETGQVEAKRVEVRSMRVAFEGEAWTELPLPVELPVTGVAIEPGGEYWKHLSPITSDVASLLDRQFTRAEGEFRDLRIRISFVGETLDGTPVESNELSYLVRICRGCVGCPPGHVMVPACSMAFAQPDGIVCEEIEIEE